MNNWANVHPDSLRKMNDAIVSLIEQLEKTKNEMKAACEASYQSGNRDIQFEKIRNSIVKSENEMLKLKNFMTRYTDYLKKQENVIRKYLAKQGPKVN